VTDSRPGPLVLASGPDDDGVAVLTLNRPEKKNALSIALREEAVAILGQLAGDEALKALVITGSGGCFSAGFDLREFAVTDPGHTERLWRSSDLFHHAVHRFPLPVIAAVDGIAYAGGIRSRGPVRPAHRDAPRGLRPSRGRARARGLRPAA
jgi:enoyl-CoA hydratase/carnithine racemase